MGQFREFLVSKLSKDNKDNFPYHFFKELEDSLNIIEDIEQIGHNFLGKIKEFIPIEKLFLVIFDQESGKFKVSNSIGFEENRIKKIFFVSTDPLAKWLKVNKTCLYVSEQPGVIRFLAKKEKETLDMLNLELCFPLVSMNRLIGIIFIGPKTDHKKFTKQELSIISTLTPQAGIALENAILYKEQRERFRRMSRADKLATIGELAAGAAHEIRNPLTAIQSSLQYLSTKIQTEKEKKLLTNALQETGRINEILSALLSFSRPSEIKKEKSNLIEILEDSLDLISIQAKKYKIKITRDYPAIPIYFNSDKAQLKQLFLNILLNSAQAMNSGGELKIGVHPKDNQKILVVVADTGEGIPEDKLDNIFDPFFTTKRGGTGLGLSICYGIIESHRGEIEVKSKVGQGTTILITLPMDF
ncbi:MAG: ATP-binding protein [Candidatus Aminicenantes bacterium]|nr:ATP-binding protein [Candidatus Aminicenantes bacterium]